MLTKKESELLKSMFELAFVIAKDMLLYSLAGTPDDEKYKSQNDRSPEYWRQRKLDLEALQQKLFKALKNGNTNGRLHVCSSV